MRGSLIFTPFFLVTICLALFNGLKAQTPLAYGQYLKQVMEFHPVIDQAGIGVEISDASLRQSQGVMDPYVAASMKEKDLKSTEYYDRNRVKVALPTALGFELFAAYDMNTGAFIDPETSTPNSGLYETGVSLPVGTSLFYNERLLAIRQGKLMVEMSEADQRIIVNDLLYRASLAYLNWSLSLGLIQTQTASLDIAQDQFEFVKQSFLSGDSPAIDTTEAFLQVQNRSYQLLTAENMEFTARRMVETFLWDDAGNPLGLVEDAQPQQMLDFGAPILNSSDSFLIWQQTLVAQHPLLNIKGLKIESIGLERQLARSNLLPQLDLKYSQLAVGSAIENIPGGDINDRIFGLEIKYPLLLRKERAKLNLASLKQETERLDRDVKVLDLQNKLSALVNDYNIATEQLSIYIQMIGNYQALLEAERNKFSIGESSVFLLNSRENKLFDAQVNQQQIQSKQIATALKVIQAANRESYYQLLIP